MWFIDHPDDFFSLPYAGEEVDDDNNIIRVNSMRADPFYLDSAAITDVSVIGIQFDHARQQKRDNSGKVPLTKAQRFHFEDVQAAALANVKSSECAIYLAGHNLVPTAIANSLALLRPFNGLLSTINALEAGVAKPTDSIASSTVQLLFFESGARAMIGALSQSTKYDVYVDLSKYDQLTLLHEAIHSATGLGDRALARRLGVYDPKADNNSSWNISKALSEHGCGGLRE